MRALAFLVRCNFFELNKTNDKYGKGNNIRLKNRLPISIKNFELFQSSLVNVGDYQVNVAK